MGLFTWLTAAPKAMDIAENLVDGAVKGIDALVFTEEEKARMGQKAFEAWLELQRVLGSESTVRSITRRILAVMILGTFLIMLIAAAVLWYWFSAWSKFILEVAGNLTSLVLAIGIFYFGYYAVGGVMKHFKNKGDKP